MVGRFRGLCRPSSQARRRPSGCPESRTARAGSSARRMAGSSSLRGPRHGPPGSIPDAVATRGQSAQPKLPVPVRDGPDGDGPEPSEERPARRSEWWRRQSRTASGVQRCRSGRDRSMHSRLARDRGHAGGMMLRNDTGDAAMLKSGFSINFQASSRSMQTPTASTRIRHQIRPYCRHVPNCTLSHVLDV